MKSRNFLLLLLLLPLFSLAQRKAIFIIADGIPADLIDTLPLPNLHEIAKEGALLKSHVGGERGGYSQTPTISAVGYNSLLTSTWLNKHNVWDNDIKQPNYHYWTLFRILKSQRPQARTAIFSTWQDNRTKLVGDHLPETGNFNVDYHVDGLELDSVHYPHDDSSNYIHQIDEMVTESAVKCIRRNAPDLTWVYLEFTDDMGHQYGDGKQFYNAIETMDKQVGRIWEAIQYRQKQFGEEWQIFITTDHGRDAQTGKNHGGQSDRERNTWIVTNAKGLNAYSNMNPGIVDIAPTILKFLNVAIPKEQASEMDGVSLTGDISIVNPTAVVQDNKLIIRWKAINPAGKTKIKICASNRFRTGGVDYYAPIGEVPVADQQFEIDLAKLTASDYYKVVLEAPLNTVNRWVRH